MTNNTIDEVTGKVSIVTGVASGIGRAIVELLHARKAWVVAEDIEPAVADPECDGLVPFESNFDEPKLRRRQPSLN